MFYPCFCYVSDDANLVIEFLISKCLAKFTPSVGCFSFLQLAVFSFLQLAVFIPSVGYFSFLDLAVFFNAWDSYLLLPKREGIQSLSVRR